MKLWNWICKFFDKTMALLNDFFNEVWLAIKTRALAEMRDFILNTVANLNISSLSNEEKRKHAIAKIKEEAIARGLSLKDSVINIAIEAAVIFLKKKIG